MAVAVWPSSHTGFKALILPALIALAIYLAAVYIVYPLYARRQRYFQYIPVSLDTEDSSTLLGRTRSGLSRVFRPVTTFLGLSGYFEYIRGFRHGMAAIIPGSRYRDRAPSFDSYFGDEELEDGVLGDTTIPGRGAVDGPEHGSQQRLSRELEAGFRDDSDSDDDGRERRLGG